MDAESSIQVQEQTEAAVLRCSRTPQLFQPAMPNAESSSLDFYDNYSSQDTTIELSPAQPAIHNAGSSSSCDSVASEVDEISVFARDHREFYKKQREAEAAIHIQEQTESAVLRHPRTPQLAQPAMPDAGSSSLDFYDNFSSQDTTIELSPAGSSSSSDSVASEVDEIALFARDHRELYKIQREAEAAIHIQEQTEAAVLRHPQTAQPAQPAVHGAGSSSLSSYDNSFQDTTTEYGLSPAQPAQPAMPDASGDMFSDAD